MGRIVEEYYQQAKIIPFILKQKIDKLTRNQDILEEFEYWIANQEYKTINSITECGYTAAKLAELSEFLDGEGAFMLLIKLRENPDSAIQKISKGFKRQ